MSTELRTHGEEFREHRSWWICVPPFGPQKPFQKRHRSSWLIDVLHGPIINPATERLRTARMILDSTWQPAPPKHITTEERAFTDIRRWVDRELERAFQKARPSVYCYWSRHHAVYVPSRWPRLQRLKRWLWDDDRAYSIPEQINSAG
jgi:hypothetical protein